MNLILYHKFFDICIIEVRLNLMEANKPLGFVRFHRIQSGRHNRYIKKNCDRDSDLFRIEN
jgi:hypothetical protein